ncbi:type 2 periplasmic-binding domain-containing protein [Verminephrobacter eiseniae]|uniref:hypothetical protein n=1 Tax=Verminephrobacter eiseniae TaxID=364317 RepID=UPI0010F2C448|nr:hypothetical protein [Verminephrobacter eiseniae]KAB7575657.1 hypothetical protein ET532_019115 [Verminephrobacter sp. Larva24]
MRRKGFLLRAPAQVTGACPGRSAPAAPGGHFASGPLRMIWPFHPGASVDGVARPVAERISRKLDPSGGRGQRAGGINAAIGAQAVVSAPPDGCTAFFATVLLNYRAIANASG